MSIPLHPTSPGHPSSQPAGPHARRFPHLFDAPLRPLFLGAALTAAGAMALWMAYLNGVAPFSRYYGPHWHAHEMLFGYTIAAMGGFLLTAVPNWTDTPPLRGLPVLGLSLLWLAGRVAPFFSGDPGLHGLSPLVVALIDLAFIPALMVAVAIPMLRSGGFLDNVVLPLLAGLFAANLFTHLERLRGLPLGQQGLYLALTLYLFAIAYIGGRVIPSFTQRLAGAHPRVWPLVEKLAPATMLVFMLTHVFVPFTVQDQLAALSVAVVHGVRLWGWWHRSIWREPLIWVLHAGYAWMVLGMFLTAMETSGWLAAGVSAHAFTVGALGMMTLGLMARAALGHTGRPVATLPLIGVAFALLGLAAMARIAATLVPVEHHLHLLMAAGGLWVAAFALFLIRYLPILLGPEGDSDN
ncbi:MAG: NnrS family protein [Nitrospirota bacterium]|nr:NnrS family protein [Nitrospirota bacterium]